MTRHEPAPEAENGGKEPNDTRPLPRWALIADVVALVLLATAIWIDLSGGFVTRVLGVRVAMRSVVRPLRTALIIIAVRHLFVRRPSLLNTVRLGVAGLLRTVRAASSALARWPAIADITPIFIATRFSVILVGWLALVTFGYAPGAPAFRVSRSELGNLPMRWDAAWYMSITLDGYQWVENPRGALNVAFFPAYPMLVRAAGLFRLTKDRADVAVWVAVAVSLVAFFAALVYLHRLARSLTDADTARDATIFLSAYPFALFYSAAYTESLFLLCAIAAFFHQARQQPGRAAVWGLLAGLTRPNGALLGASLGLMALGGLWRWLGTARELRGALRRALLSSLPALGAASAPVAGVLVFSIVVWYHTGNPFQWIEIQRIGWAKTAADFSLFWGSVEQVQKQGLLLYFETLPVDTLNLAATLFALVSVWPVTVRLGLPYGVFVALTTLLPLANGGLLSMGRYTSVLFPTFIWLAMAVPPRFRSPVVFVFATLQAIVAALFYTWRWLI